MIVEKTTVWILLWSILTYFSFTQEMIWIFALLMGLDFIFAIVARWIYKPDEVESKAAVKGIVRKIGIFMLPFIVVIGGKVMGTLIWEEINFFFIASVCMGFLIMQELYSLMRHIYNISTWQHLPEYEVATKIMKAISYVLKSTIDRKTDEMIEKYDVLVSNKKDGENTMNGSDIWWA